MFFAPPKVKSLSRYAEYGAYLGHKHFLMMLALAIAAHIGVIAIYAMKPKEQVIHIPVRALNIKLSGGSSANGIKMPAPEAMPVTPEENTGISPDNQNTLRDQPNTKKIADEHKEKKEPASPPVAEPVHVTKEGKPRIPAFTLATPKRYVREYSAPHKKAHAKSEGGNGSGISGDAAGNEMIERYTQTVSQWIKNHQDYARAAYNEAVQGQNKVAGQAVIRLRIDRTGHILYSGVDRTSGNELVDQMAIVMVRASDPVPVVPNDYPGDSQLEFLIAVQVDFSKQ